MTKHQIGGLVSRINYAHGVTVLALVIELEDDAGNMKIPIDVKQGDFMTVTFEVAK